MAHSRHYADRDFPSSKRHRTVDFGTLDFGGGSSEGFASRGPGDLESLVMQQAATIRDLQRRLQDLEDRQRVVSDELVASLCEHQSHSDRLAAIESDDFPRRVDALERHEEGDYSDSEDDCADSEDSGASGSDDYSDSYDPDDYSDGHDPDDYYGHDPDDYEGAFYPDGGVYSGGEEY